MNYGKVEERSSSQSRFPNTARRVATSAILTDILSRSDRAPTSRTVEAAIGATRVNSRHSARALPLHLAVVRRGNQRRTRLNGNVRTVSERGAQRGSTRAHEIQ